MKTKKQYRLPNGDMTKDINLYLSVYEDLAKRVLDFFPGYVFDGIGSDWGLKFVWIERYESGKTDAFYAFTLPLAACLLLVDKQTPERVRRFDL